MVERHFADGSPIASEVQVAFDDYGLYNGAPADTVPFGVNCAGIIGPDHLPGDKHCEHTETSCASDSACAAGVACRETDRLDADTISITGLEGGKLDLERLGVGRFSTTGLGKVFGTGYIYMTADPSESRSLTRTQFFYTSGIMPQLVAVTSPDLAGTATVGGEDLEIRWEKMVYGMQESNRIYIELRAGQEGELAGGPVKSGTRRLLCVVVDDGCKTVPAAALQWLTSTSPTKLGVMISHHFPYVAGEMSTGTSGTDFVTTLIKEVHGSFQVKR